MRDVVVFEAEKRVSGIEGPVERKRGKEKGSRDGNSLLKLIIHSLPLTHTYFTLTECPHTHTIKLPTEAWKITHVLCPHIHTHSVSVLRQKALYLINGSLFSL